MTSPSKPTPEGDSFHSQDSLATAEEDPVLLRLLAVVWLVISHEAWKFRNDVKPVTVVPSLNPA
jgi:hypothetical protein